MTTIDELMERYKKACNFENSIDEKKIVIKLKAWIVACSGDASVRFIRSGKGLKKVAWDAWDARVALDARNAWIARNAWDAWDAWIARNAWDAWDARVALDARNAWNARDARVARNAWNARDMSYMSLIYIGAVSNNSNICNIWKPFFEAFEAGAWNIYITKNTIWVITYPTLYFDVDHRLHNPFDAAFKMLKDVKEYYWHGVNVSADIILYPENISVSWIRNEGNIEIRRVLIERYEEIRYPGAFIADCGAAPIQSDEFGVLYRVEVAGDEPIVMVKVKNRTPESDGSFRDYFLRVDSRCRPMLDVANNRFGAPQKLTARNAVASTYGMTGEEYVPLIES